jgi:hypothetical protein
MNLEGKTIAVALHLCCSRKRMTRVKKRHMVEATSEQYLSLQQEIESRTDFALPLHPEPFPSKAHAKLYIPFRYPTTISERIGSECN